MAADKNYFSFWATDPGQKKMSYAASFLNTKVSPKMIFDRRTLSWRSNGRDEAHQSFAAARVSKASFVPLLPLPAYFWNTFNGEFGPFFVLCVTFNLDYSSSNGVILKIIIDCLFRPCLVGNQGKCLVVYSPSIALIRLACRFK